MAREGGQWVLSFAGVHHRRVQGSDSNQAAEQPRGPTGLHLLPQGTGEPHVARQTGRRHALVRELPPKCRPRAIGHAPPLAERIRG